MMQNVNHHVLLAEDIKAKIANVADEVSVKGFSFGEIYAENIKKLQDRLNRNVIQGSGDDR